MAFRLQLISFICVILISCSATSIVSRNEANYRITVPEAPWHLEIPATKYEFRESTLEDSTSGSATFDISMENISIIIGIAPAGAHNSAIEFRNSVDSLTATVFTRENVYKSHNQDAAFLEFDLTNVGGIKLYPRHIFKACYLRDGYSVVVTITAFRYRQQHRHLLDEAIRGIHFVQK